MDTRLSHVFQSLGSLNIDFVRLKPEFSSQFWKRRHLVLLEKLQLLASPDPDSHRRTLKI